ncbi:uncharacterized protein BDR25DRAFT_366028 [Lindgomyces ingoldianus]|uniref:Uncharacterized protein n=1 Tax=Lindgomyces ingoldianus TaxID=673940 RepID=A0ACB6R153_9PLEO|nr:uncharacterized protein BDR25DRAFT_366028 [Lindgomyces ingoldianus]KAF2472815.1 hypothetical protein BDR25DRAFT_366028 [Lindgomyces ingoldianus]
MADAPPPGYRFSTVTPDDHGGLIYIAAFLSFIYSSITFIARCFIKWRVFGFDDWAMMVAQIITVVQFVVLLVALNAGLGKSFDLLTEDQYSRTATSQYANQVVFYLSIGLSKCAAVLLIQRLFTRDAKKFWMICNVVTGLMAVWTIVATLAVSVGCNPKSTLPALEEQTCPSLLPRYQVIIITDTVTDVLLVLVPAYLVWQLQMSKALKLQVISAFAVRLPLLPLSILVLITYKNSLHSSNPGVDRTTAIIFQQSQLCFSLMAGTIPCLKSFIRSFDTGSGAKVGYTTHAYGSNGYAGGGSYKMQSLSGSGSAMRSHKGDDGDVKVSKPQSGRRKHNKSWQPGDDYPARRSMGSAQ